MSSDRLPSFKGPRDLSLSARGAKKDGAGQSAAAGQRPRRVFTPNIPPKRDRGGAQSSTSAGTSGASKKEVVDGSSNSRGRPPRGRGTPRGGGRGGKRPELVQSESIFADGFGEKRAAAMSYRSGGSGWVGGSRYKSGGSGEGGSSRMSSMNRATLTTIIKEEDDESNRKIFGSEKFERDEDQDLRIDHPTTPIVLPLLGYVPDLYLEPSALPSLPIAQDSEKSPARASTSTDCQNATLSLVQVKEEKVDEVASITKIKEEKLDEPESEGPTNLRDALASMTLDATSFAGTFRSNPPEGTLVYFQFPDELPILEGSIRESVDQQDNGKNGADLVKDINDLPEGFIGRIQIMSSGRTRFVVGENTFDVDPGRAVGFRQELCAIDTESKTLNNLGPLNRKFVITPDIESLILDAL